MRTCYEAKRGCGFRKGGGLYLMSDAIGVTCEALPIATEVCPACGHGIKPSRGWTWIEPDVLLAEHLGPHGPLGHDSLCPLGAPGRLGERCGLLWIGEAHYATPEEWIAEGRAVGFSRRVRGVPRGFEAGVTWVLAGHRKVIEQGYRVKGNRDETVYPTLATLLNGHGDAQVMTDDVEVVYSPGIFHVWLPTRVEYVVKGDETEEELAALEERGIEPVKVVPVQEELHGEDADGTMPSKALPEEVAS